MGVVGAGDGGVLGQKYVVGVKDDVDDDVGARMGGSGGAGGGMVPEGGEGVIGAQVGIGRIGAGVEVLDVHVGV